MTPPITSDDIDKVLAEADELINGIHLSLYRDAHEKEQVELEKRLQTLKTARARIEEKIDTEQEPEKISSYAEGYHEAFEEITKALRDLKAVLT
jgi:hypothetical protein